MSLISILTKKLDASPEISSQYVFVKSEKESTDTKVIHLLLAAELGLTDRIEAILDDGIDVNARINIHQNALIKAASNNQYEAVDLLLRRGAKVDSVDNLGNTPLMMTTDTSIVKRLIESGANINHTNTLSHTPLICQAFRNNSDAVKALHAAGAPLEYQSADGCTAIVHAAQSNAIETVQILIELGADHSGITNPDTMTTLHNTCPDLYAMLCAYLERRALEMAIGNDEDRLLCVEF